MDAKKCSWVGSALLVGPRAAICAPTRYHSRRVCQSPVSPLSSISDLARRSLTHHANVPPGLIRRPPCSFTACSFAPQHPLSTCLTQAQAVGVWHALLLLLAFWPSGARSTHYKTNGSSAACSFYCTCVAVAMSGRANNAHARAARASVWAQGMLLAGQWALCTS